MEPRQTRVYSLLTEPCESIDRLLNTPETGNQVLQIIDLEKWAVADPVIRRVREILPDQAKGYLRASQHNVQFVFSSNGYMFVEFDRSTGMTTEPRPLSELAGPTTERTNVR